MTEPERYPTAKGVEDAIKAAARRASAADPSLTTDQRIRLERFNRFLSRVFSEGPNSEWLLKGGTGMLARVPSTRATLDIDLYREGYGLDDAVADLRRLAEHDLGDHFRFVYVGHRAIVGGEGQPYTDGYRVEFDTYIGAQKKARIGVDLATDAGLTAEPTVTAPASALDLPRLVGFDYRLYPVVDQIADKVCATMHRYGDRPSSRELPTRRWRGPCPTAPTYFASTPPAIWSRPSSIQRWTTPLTDSRGTTPSLCGAQRQHRRGS